MPAVAPTGQALGTSQASSASSPASTTTAARFRIQEKDSQDNTIRDIMLTARGLPFRPLTIEGKQRGEITWYPGNPVGTNTVLGASEEPTTVNGFWHDLYLSGSGTQGGTSTQPITSNGTQVTTAKDAVQLFDDVRRQGHELVVTWDEITRRGILRSFKQEWHNIHDVAWTATFDWFSHNEPQQAAVTDNGNSTNDTNSQMTAQMNALTTVAGQIGFGVPATFAQNLALAIGVAQTGVNNAVNAGNVQNTGATNPNDAARRVLASTSAVIDGTGQVIAAMTNRPARTLASDGAAPAASGSLPVPPSFARAPTAFTSVASTGALAFGQIVAAEAYAYGVFLAARTLQRTAAISRATIARSLQNDLIGVYQARNGDDLRTVAEQFYGSRLQWRPLLLFNELSSTELTAGQIVLVPRLPSGAS